MAGEVDYGSLRTDWSAFFGLLSNERGLKLRLNLPDTLVLKHGHPQQWYATNTEGYVVQRSAALSSMEDVRQHLLTCSLDSHSSYPQHAAIMRLQDGVPKLLTRAALDALCERLAVEQKAGEAGVPEQTPCVLQACPEPFLDLRFVTSYNNTGASTSCHTFQRRFSRRYLPLRDATSSAVLLPDALSRGPLPLVQQPTPPVFPLGGPASPPVLAPAAAAPGAAYGAAQEEEAGLDDGALADSERNLSKTLGPVDPSLKMLVRKAAHGLVQYVQKAHLLTLRGLVCEFVLDGEGHLWFLGPLRTDWASLIPGRGGEPWANANLTQQPQDEASWPSSMNEESDQQHGQQDCSAVESRQAAGSVSPAAGSPVRSSGLPAVELAAHLPLPPALQQADVQQPASPAVAARLAPLPAAAASPMPLSTGAGSPGAKQAVGSPGTQRPSPEQALPLRGGMRRSPGNTGQRERMQASYPGGSGRRQVHSTSPGGGSSGGGTCTHWGPGVLPRGPAALTSHLTKELESLKEEVLIKTDLVDALAIKVDALEHDKHVVTGAFEQVLGSLQSDLQEVKERLEDLRAERDRLACQLAEAQQGLASAEIERGHLRVALDAERGTAFMSISQFQRQQEDAGLRAARAEAELRSMQERLREEQAACDALKKQMVFYQHTLGDSSSGQAVVQLLDSGKVMWRQERPEVEYAETLQAVDELLLRESDPSGERYSLSKVLHTCQADLHAIFLHYCLMDAGFARHWPPKLSLAGWLAFMKEIGSTNLVPGTRTRSDNTLHVQEATDVFRRYCLRQAVMKGTLPARVLSQRDLFHDAASASAAPGEQPPRPTSGQSAVGGQPSSRPFSATSVQLSGASMSYQSFCAALVHVAAKLARGSMEALEACPFLSEQTRSFVDSILPKAQQVMPTVQATTRKGGAGAVGGAVMALKPTSGIGAKEAAAKEAAAKLPKLKNMQSKSGAEAAALSRAGGSAGAEFSTITEASREGSVVVPLGCSGGA